MIKDSANLTATMDINNHLVNVHACDVDSDGNVENVDIVVDGELKMCFNSQDSEQCKSAIDAFLRLLWNVSE